VDRLIESQVPFSMIGRTGHPEGVPFVDIDFEAMVKDSLDYLVELGHENVALVLEGLEGSAMAGYGPSVRTEATFTSSMIHRGLVPTVIECAGTPQGGREAAAELLESRPDVTAIIIMNDLAAFGMVNGLAAAGLSVPRDVSVLSVATSQEMASLSEPVLTAMNAPGAELGRLGVDYLIDQLEGTSTAIPQVLISCEFQVNDSTARVRIRS
jgi:DNA-binding LacI/PurR family transcriptional regulator